MVRFTCHFRNAIVGVTEQFMMEAIDFQTFDAECEQFRDLRLKFNMPGRGDESTVRDDIISYEIDLEFNLMRHWTIYESIFHSKKIASILSVWNDAGRRKLDTFLAKMG